MCRGISYRMKEYTFTYWMCWTIKKKLYGGCFVLLFAHALLFLRTVKINEIIKAVSAHPPTSIPIHVLKFQVHHRVINIISQLDVTQWQSIELLPSSNVDRYHVTRVSAESMGNGKVIHSFLIDSTFLPFLQGPDCYHSILPDLICQCHKRGPVSLVNVISFQLKQASSPIEGV